MLNTSVAGRLNSNLVRELAAECGFEFAGVTLPHPVSDFTRFEGWVERGFAGEMRYLTDHRAQIRSDPAFLLPGVRSVICTGTLYNSPEPYSTEFTRPELGWIARYAWGEDYHSTIKLKLEQLAFRLLKLKDFSWRVCVDTAPLLERSLAREAGLGWIGKNTCLINQSLGSWLFLGELLTTLDLPPDKPTPDRCGTCTRCIEACPTQAIVPSPDGRFELDARLCISYFTIESRGRIPEEHRAPIGNNVFGCDICQDVCPWNRKAPRHNTAVSMAAPLERLAEMSAAQFREVFRGTAVSRARYSGFLRNVAIAMGNAGSEKFRAPLQKLAASSDPVIAEHARWALSQLRSSPETDRSPGTPPGRPKESHQAFLQEL